MKIFLIELFVSIVILFIFHKEKISIIGELDEKCVELMKKKDIKQFQDLTHAKISREYKETEINLFVGVLGFFAILLIQVVAPWIVLLVGGMLDGVIEMLFKKPIIFQFLLEQNIGDAVIFTVLIVLTNIGISLFLNKIIKKIESYIDVLNCYADL